MNPGRWTIPFVLMPGALIGCIVPQEPLVREPVRWIVVEKRTRDLAKEGLLIDRPLNESSTLLAMQPLYSEDLNWRVSVETHDYFVQLLGVTPTHTVAPGETVSAKVRVGRARPEESYRLIAQPSNREVQIIGELEYVVRGNGMAVFRFTSICPGKAGIAVRVERVEP